MNGLALFGVGMLLALAGLVDYSRQNKKAASEPAPAPVVSEKKKESEAA